MLICKWEELPDSMQVSEVRRYYDLLKEKKISLLCKRLFDIVLSVMLLIVFSPLFLVLAIAIKTDSPGPVFYRQTRVTQYGKLFKIHKFRSMVNDADKKGSLVTVAADMRVTKVGKIIRKYRLDEISQLLDVLSGNMTFVGTRPEVSRYVDEYTEEMRATLLMPAGITSLASIFYKDEADLLDGAENPDEVYVKKILPEKMMWNLKGIEKFSFISDIKIMVMTVLAVIGKDYEREEMK